MLALRKASTAGGSSERLLPASKDLEASLLNTVCTRSARPIRFMVPVELTSRGSPFTRVSINVYLQADQQHTMVASLVAAPISAASFLASRPAVRRSRAAHVKVS